MALFQKSVLSKYLKTLDDKKVNEAYQKFTAFFHNPTIIQNIRDDKEEQFQYGFLQKLFDEVLDYTINPNIDFNLSTEFKNLRGAKKADGAILKGGKAVGVIELKSTKTKELAKITDQAFGYKNNHPTCVYVVTSNFEKLRFYINDAVDYLDFDLFTLNAEQFKLMYLCLQKDQILQDIPQKIKKDSTLQEENVTKKLYKDYSAFKNALYHDLVLNNPEVEKLTLFKKSQKLIDRFLFIFFAEDKGLLPPNSISKIVKHFEAFDALDDYRPLYDVFKRYFGYINGGRPAKNGKAEIFAFNGGLFAPDATLDTLKITDAILMNHSLVLSGYDFESEVDVNILGHIFEHSLNEIDEIAAEIAGEEIDKSKTKRKKDGVFYTPKYITKYIVDNTVGKLCDSYKEEHKFDENEYRPNRTKAVKKRLLEELEAYRAYLLSLTICDPACGSGAFLNQALDFLIREHRYIDELQTRLLGGSIILSDITNDILERNIYGVDINEESVDIARLSLWLRTAQKGRALTTLSSNIKCGNSLIDDVEAAGEKSFGWEKEFPDVFANGGFDVIIGNPPYLRVQGLRDSFEKESVFYEKEFHSATGRFDIYVLFIEKTYQLINDLGKVSLILPHKFMVSDFGEGIRKFLSNEKAVESILHFGAEMVFQDASTYTCILALDKNIKEKLLFKKLEPINIFDNSEFDSSDYKNFNSEKWTLKSNKEESIFAKLNQQALKVKDVFSNISQGVVSVGDDIFLLKGEIIGDVFKGFSTKTNSEVEIEAMILKPILKGEDVKKYSPLNNSYYVLYPHFEDNGKTKPYEETDFKNKFPKAYSYILPFKDELIEKKIRYKTNSYYWYALHRSREMSLFEQKKIITPEISLGTNMTLDENHIYHNTKCYSLIKRKGLNASLKFLLAVLNSELTWFYLKNTGYVLRGGFFTFKTKYLEPIPFPAIPNNDVQKHFEYRVDSIMELNSKLMKIVTSFERLLFRKFPIEKLSKNLQNWHTLTFTEFVKELKKKKVKLGLSEESEWEDYFETEKAKAMEIQAVIDKTDREIDRMVYDLYGLTAEEIAVVENA